LFALSPNQNGKHAQDAFFLEQGNGCPRHARPRLCGCWLQATTTQRGVVAGRRGCSGSPSHGGKNAHHTQCGGDAQEQEQLKIGEINGTIHALFVVPGFD
jgi:hypothetical protein